jgi:hypothetical protein
LEEAAMAEPHVISALKAKRAEIAGELAGLAKEIALRQADLQHVDATLRLFAPDFAPEAIRPKQQRMHSIWFRRGERARLTFDILRAARAPLTAIEIVQRLMAAKNIDLGDGRAQECIRQTVYELLRHAHAKGTVERTGSLGEAAGWRIAKGSDCAPRPLPIAAEID